MLGQIALERNDPRAAESFFRRALGETPRLGVASRGLALALLQQDQPDKALAIAQTVLADSDGKDVDAKYLLAAVYHELGRSAAAEPLLEEVLAATPDASHALLMQGLVKIDLRQPDEAEPLLRKVIQREPGSLWARLGLALIRRTRGDLATARADLERLTVEQPDWALAQLHLAQTLLLLGQREAALRALRESEKASPNTALAQLRTAKLVLDLGDPDGAIVKSRAALGTPALAPVARAVLVRALLIKGKPDLAEGELTSAVNAAPGDVAALTQLGRFLLSQRRPQEALSRFQAASKLRPNAAEPLKGEVEAYLALGQRDEALATAEQIARLQGGKATDLLYLGAIQERAGRADEAARTYQRLAENGTHLAATRALARLYAGEHREAEAVQLLEAAAQVHPQSSRPWVDLANLQLRRGDRSAAIAAYRRALERDAESPALLNDLAYQLVQDDRTLEEGLALAEDAYRRAPTSAAIADTLGFALYRKGDLARAEKLLSQAVILAPRNGEIRYHLGLTYAKQRRSADARLALQEALQAGPFPSASDARRVLESLP
jgi:tetratricopeptide (TPR) repeat protein